ncbi:SH3 domain-containing protein [Trinickia fusca]|uniref:Peptide-binding protein n=1 Tax=Trinickia fusca TaxID=2419777 RepID=A0A494XAY0_9BURK|nr:SH3 domain-containing protein [Trinickia fusca]RKP45249.1 peptide-binding protein [Trinickia fusca]
MQKHFAMPAIAAGVGLLMLSGTTLAQTQAYTNAPVEIYAGPAPDYPVVAQVPEGTALAVMGCVEDYSWCDVAAPGLRGWVYAEYLSYPYQGAEVPIVTYGATIGLPVVVFSIDSYWGRYYRDRSWYHDESRWAHHQPPSRVARPPEHGEMGRPPGPYPGHAPPPNDRAPGAPVHGGPPQARPQPGLARPMEQPAPHTGGPQPHPGAQPESGPAHSMGGPPTHGGPGAAPMQRGGAEERGGQPRGGEGGGGEHEDHQDHQPNH